jgi:hypothetical protein
MRSIVKIVLAAVLVPLIGWATEGSARAQALADRIPSDALVYIGWKGVDTPAAGYDADLGIDQRLDSTTDRADQPGESTKRGGQ